MVSEYNKTFDKQNYTVRPLERGDYEKCIFQSCDLSNAVLTDQKFFDCRFIDCNLSLARLDKTLFRDVQFKQCKMLGLLFEKCNEHGLTVAFDSCNLTHSSFYGRKIKNSRFSECQLIEVDFSGCDLSGSTIYKCDLASARFENTVLDKADLRQSYNFVIDPEMNRLKGARFSLTELAGLLQKYQIRIDNDL